MTPETGAFEAVVTGAPVLLNYDVAAAADGTSQADIIAVFHTSQDTAQDTAQDTTLKPGRRD